MQNMWKLGGVVLMSLGLISFSVSAETTQAKTIFATDWSAGIDKRIEVEAVDKRGIQIVSREAEGGPPAMEAKIYRNGSYQALVNGTPRAELSFANLWRFSRGNEYIISWQIEIPKEYKFDERQPEVISQIHQGARDGFPTFSLVIDGSGKYAIYIHAGRSADAVKTFFGSPLKDRGKTIDWRLRYIPSDTGSGAVTEVYKNGACVFEQHGVANAYPNDDESYFKFGVYKAEWQRARSDVDVRTLLFGKISVSEKDAVQ